MLNCPKEEEVRWSIIKGRSCDYWAIAYRQHHTTKFAVRQEHSSKPSTGVCCLNSKILILLLLLLLNCVCDVYMGMHVSPSACGGQITNSIHVYMGSKESIQVHRVGWYAFYLLSHLTSSTWKLSALLWNDSNITCLWGFSMHQLLSVSKYPQSGASC